MGWTHVVIEIYSDDDGCWPKEGNAADWIEKGLVGWCLGDDDTVVYFMPFYKILWLKIKKWADDIHTWFFINIYTNEMFPWGRRWYREAEKWWDME